MKIPQAITLPPKPFAELFPDMPAGLAHEADKVARWMRDTGLTITDIGYDMVQQAADLAGDLPGGGVRVDVQIRLTE